MVVTTERCEWRLSIIGKSVRRIESKDKVSGFAKYTNDTQAPNQLHGWIVISPHAHAEIVSLDVTKALEVSGVHTVITGDDAPILTGALLPDRPPLAREKVRYYGEPIAVVVAETEQIAKLAADYIRAEFIELPVVNSPRDAIQTNAPLVHENLGNYQKIGSVYPVPHTNIANQVKIRKGDMQAGWTASEVVVEGAFAFNTSDHTAMEPRCSIVEVKPSGLVDIQTSTQDPFMIKRSFERFFQVEQSKVIVHVPFVGGGFGGKGSIQLEYLAYLASKACGGHPVKINNSRETDMVSSPSHIGLEAKVKIGSTQDGKLKAMEITFLFDTGGYSDAGPAVTQAAAVDCTGPYKVDNVWCDSLCMYTNHPYANAFRGFGHTEAAFCVERTMDLLAKKLHMDPMELRLRNVIRPGDTTPTQATLTRSNIGDLKQCILKLRNLIKWDEGQWTVVNHSKIRTKGMACVWKTSSSAMDTGSGATITCNQDGSLNLSVGSIEIGQGNRTIMAQILAERMKMPVAHIHVKMDVDTQITPEHWKTVASSSTMMVGRAVLNAADDVIAQLKHNASLVLERNPDQLEVSEGKVYVRDNPSMSLQIKKLVSGYTYPDGRASGEPVIGRGSYRVHNLSKLDPETGKGMPGHQWTVGAQAVEVEFDTRDCTYRILRAASVFDAGKVINEATANGQVMGAMNMGLSFATREGFLYNDAAIVLNPQLRSYKLMRFGGNPKYLVDFVETPFLEGPYGARGVGEHGTIGMAACLANALSLAAGCELNILPLIPELIWRTRGGR